MLGDTYTPEPILSLPAAAALAALTFVSVNSSGQWAQTAAGALPAGILPRDAAAPVNGVADQVRAYLGPMGARFKALAGGTIAAGDRVSVGANGKLVKSVTSGHVYIGTCVEGCVAGDHASFIFQPYGVVP